MKRRLSALFAAQKLALVCSYWFFRFATPSTQRDSVDWVVGPVEIASVVKQFGSALPNAVTVNLVPQRLYSFRYDWDYDSLAGASRLFAFSRVAIKRAILLGKLMNVGRGFLYVAQFGFLLHGHDAREFEFRFLKSKSRKIGIFWTGSEIRSPRLSAELERTLGVPNIFSYVGQISPEFLSDAHEDVVRQRAHVGESFADIMFDSPTDQVNYLSGHREPNFFLMGPEKFATGREKFDDLTTPVIVHASTSPIIKGTPLVRAAIAHLQEEGYQFEYIELIRMSQDQVVEALGRAHIALNHFYGFTVSVFGVEAMAAQCAVLSSADERLETTLPPGANEANFVTKHWQVYDHLKFLLDNPGEIEQRADAGRAWALRYASVEHTGPRVNALLASVLDGTYDAAQRAALSNVDVHGGQTGQDS